jgi:uncharacterized protein (DUF2249 family)
MNSPAASTARTDTVLDVRTIPCSVKHGLVVRTWRELPLGNSLILLNDHDPAPLHRQFDVECPGTFTWEYLQQDPKEFRIKLTKLKVLPPIRESGKPYGCSGH